MSRDIIPAPPEGYFTLDHGSSVRFIDTKRLRRTERGVSQPMPGVLVWAEGAWKPVLDFRGAFRRTVEVDYAESSNPARTIPEGHYMQRLAPERIAVDAVAGERIIAMREARQAEERTRAQRAEARQAEREIVKRQERARIEAEAAEREAAMTPAQRLAKVRRDLAVGRELVDGAQEEIEQAQARLARYADRVAVLEATEAKLAAEAGEG